MEQSIKVLQLATEQGPDNLQQIFEEMSDLENQVSRSPRQALHPTVVHARTLLSEYYEYLGAYSKASKILQPYLAGNQSKIAVPRILLHLGHVRYRERDFDEAQRLIERAIQMYLDRKDRFGLAMAYFYYAKALHRARRLVEARKRVEAALELFGRKGSAREIHYRHGVCQLLLGWLDFRDGNLQAASLYLGQAQVGIPHGDFIHRGKIHCIRGCIVRSTAVAEHEFKNAAAAFREALKLYRAVEARTYEARALNNLGHTQTRSGEFDEAHRTFKLASTCRSEDDRTAVETAYFVARLRLKEALSTATENLEAPAWTHAQTAVNAAIASADTLKIRSLQAETRVDKTRLILAAPSLESDPGVVHGLVAEAREYGKGDVKTIISCDLLEAEIRCKDRPPDPIIAEAFLRKASDALRPIQNQFLQSWADRVRGLIASVDGSFHIASAARSLSWHAHDEGLRVWLVTQAIQRTSQSANAPIHRQKLATALGVKRQTLERWLIKWRDLVAEADSRAGGDTNQTAAMRRIVDQVYRPKA
jgi:tetratricopeptide (TPR) repeat protein